MDKKIETLLETLSPIERKIVPFLNESLKIIQEKSKLDETTILKALRFLENKEVLILKSEKQTMVELDTNGIYYKKHNLPERNLLLALESKSPLILEEAKSNSKLSDNEFKVSLGILKSKALIELKNGKIFLNAKKEEIGKKTFEEILLEKLPTEKSNLVDSDLLALSNLQKRKEIIEMKEVSIVSFTLTPLGKEISGKTLDLDLIEEATPEIIKSYKGKKFRRYDLQAPVPKIHGGKKHFVNQSIEYGKRIWLDLGFKEMSGDLTQTSFWNFDALFTAQDHPVREMQDTFFIKEAETKLPDKSLVSAVKKAHESGVSGSKGWQYLWDSKLAKSSVLRTHTTCLSAHTLASLNIKTDLPAKFFSIGKCFRNETVDWSHGFEFYQTEGIVISEDLTFRHLLGYLEEFYKKMGFEKIRFSPAYFPYTEPSVEVSVFHPERKVWLELGGAGIFRPELTIPLLGKAIPVLAWGQGFDRIITDFYKIKDLREMYSNDLKSLREKRAWLK